MSEAETPPEAYEDAPDWSCGGKVHNWRTHISDRIMALWPTFTTEQRLALIADAEDDARAEEWE